MPRAKTETLQCGACKIPLESGTRPGLIVSNAHLPLASLDKRPNPVGPEERARMVQSEDCGDLIRYIACLPPHVCINEVLISPTWNRSYVAGLQRKGA